MLAALFFEEGKGLQIELWDCNDSQLRARRKLGLALDTKPLDAAPVSLMFSADGRTLVTGDGSGRIVLWDPATAQQRQTLQLPGPVYAFDVAQDGRHLAVANANGTVYVLRLEK